MPISREAWEETGLIVHPDSILGVYGGPECVVRYPNGDEVQYVITAFGCTVTGGVLRPDLEETVAAAYWSEGEATGLALAPWLRAHLPLVYAGTAGAGFAAAQWINP